MSVYRHGSVILAGHFHFYTRWNWTQFENSCSQGEASDILNLSRGNVGYQRKFKAGKF